MNHQEDEIDPDLEERLYAQIHHKEDDSIPAASEESVGEGSDLLLSLELGHHRNPRNRYWSESSPRPQPPRPVSGTTFRRPTDSNTVLGLSARCKMAQTGPNRPDGYKAYTSVLQQWGAAASAATTSSAASIGGTKSFRKPENVPKKTMPRPPDAQMSKLVQKYLAKAQKAQMAKKKSKARQLPVLPTISLDSSSSDEDDDVIEIPVPPPPLVCLDDSSDDSMQAPISTPNTSKAINAAAMARASRCSSPSSSVISDDFIAPLDRHCLSDSMDSVMTEEDLRAAGKTRASVAEALIREKESGTSAGGKSTESVGAANSCSKSGRQRIPLLYKNLISSQKDVTIERYHEDEASANDVVLLLPAVTETVEAEAPPPAAAIDTQTTIAKPSTPEASVYAKGSASKQKAVACESSSDSEDAAAHSTPQQAKRMARVPKRRPQRPDDSSDSEAIVGVPYIRSGEAVSQAHVSPKRRDPKKRQRLSSNMTTATPEADNAFISIISSIAQGGDVSDSDSVEILPSTIEEVTLCSTDDSAKDIQTNASSTLTFNEFPHATGLKLVPIERKDPWQICDADRLGPKPVARVRCLNCNQMGHIRARCNMPYRPPQCYMCGEVGHREPRCRKTICLQCGSPTQIYQIRCRECHQMSNQRCRNCWGMGHTDWFCPEKWRRYHSTTEDTAKLRTLKGPLIKRTKYCSVCARRGHSAEECRMANAFLDFRVAPMAIVRYDSIYPGPHAPPSRFSEQEQSSMPKRQRLREKRSRERQQLVKDQLDSTVVQQNEPARPLEEIQLPVVPESNETVANSEARVIDTTTAPVNETVEKKELPAPVEGPQEFKITVDVQSDERMVTSTTKTNEQAVEPSIRKLSPNSDSNYSFSDFFEKERGVLSTTTAVASVADPIRPSMAEDFLSINSRDCPPPSTGIALGTESSSQVTSSRPNNPQSTSSTLATSNTSLAGSESEARIYLSKEHSKILINSTGSKFLQEMSQIHNVRVRLEWQSIGNLLTVYGLGIGLNSFHVDLTKYLSQEDDRSAAKQVGNQIPKMRESLARFIGDHIGQLKANLGNVYDLYRKIQEYEKYGGGKKSSKNAEKAQRKLNMILMGQAGLRDGRRRLDELKRCQEQLARDTEGPTAVAVELRDEIEKHFRYIFSSVKHDNYPDLLNRYGAWRRSSRQQLSLNNTRPDGRSGGRASNENYLKSKRPPLPANSVAREDG